MTVRFDLTGVSDRELPLILTISPFCRKHATDLERFPDASLAKPLRNLAHVVADVKPGRLSCKEIQIIGAAIRQASAAFIISDEIDIQYFRYGISFRSLQSRAA